jgi:hypothetical protein
MAQRAQHLGQATLSADRALARLRQRTVNDFFDVLFLSKSSLRLSVPL